LKGGAAIYKISLAS